MVGHDAVAVPLLVDASFLVLWEPHSGIMALLEARADTAQVRRQAKTLQFSRPGAAPRVQRSPEVAAQEMVRVHDQLEAYADEHAD